MYDVVFFLIDDAIYLGLAVVPHSLQYLNIFSATSFPFGFRTKVTILVCTLVLATWGTVFYWTSERFNAALVKELTSNVGTDARLMSVRLSTDMKRFAEDVHMLERMLPVQALVRLLGVNGMNEVQGFNVRQWKNRLATIFTEMLEAKSDYFQIRYIGVAHNGRELVRVEKQRGIIKRVAEAELQEKGNEVYVQDTVKQLAGKPYYSQITLNREHGKVMSPYIPTLRVSVPVFMPSGDVFGLIVVNVDMRHLFSNLQANLKSQQVLYVTNSAGEFVFHPDPDKVIGIVFGQRNRLQDMVPEATSWIEHASQHEPPFIYNNVQQDFLIGMTKAFPNPTDPRHFVIVAFQDSYRQVFANAVMVQKEAILLSIALLVFAFIGAFILARFIVAPLKKLNDATTAVGRGERPTMLPVYSQDEIGKLFRSFNAMAIKVEERTEALAQKETQMRTIVEAAPSGMIMINDQGIIELVNQMVTQQFGYSRESLIGQPIETLIPERFRAKHVGDREAYFAFPEPRSMGQGWDLYGLRQDQTEFPVEIGLNPLTTDQGHFVLASIVDITARRQSEQAIQQLHRQNELILASAGEGIYGMDLDGNATFINPAAARMLGYEPAELLGQPMHSMIHHTKSDGSPYPQQDCPCFSAISKKHMSRVTNEVLWSKNGTSFPVEYTSTPIRDESGLVTGAVVTFNDITMEKSTEVVLERYIDDLRRSNAELEQFAYVASHDLQEPLRKIRNFAELLEVRVKGSLPQEAEKLLPPIVDGAIRMQALVQDLLTYSRVTRFELSPEPVNLQTIAANVKMTLEEVLSETQGTLIIGSLPTIPGHAIQLEQLLQNLIGNGLKYRGPQAPVIEVSAIEKPEQWEIAVRDNGIGFDMQYAERIFVIFQRLHTKKKYTGTGIGLAICKKIVELHGGRIWVESTLGTGSTFFFSLPHARVETHVTHLESHSRS
ncbi:PAS domain S-box protein [Nitrospira sp. M1]